MWQGFLIHCRKSSVLSPGALSPSRGPPQRSPLSLRHWPEAASPPGPCPFPGSVAAPVSVPHILSRGPSPAAFASPGPSTAGALGGLSFGSSPAPVSCTGMQLGLGSRVRGWCGRRGWQKAGQYVCHLISSWCLIYANPSITASQPPPPPG